MQPLAKLIHLLPFVFFIATTLLSGCGKASHNLVKPTVPSTLSTLSEPDPHEVIIVINNNSVGGTHAGIFAGTRLNDPSGSYIGVRSADRNWPGPSLSDYVAYQKEDGEHIQLYRFRLSPEDFSMIDARMAAASPTPPLFCAAEVKQLIAGIGPFTALHKDGWISPAGLSEILNNLTHQSIGICQQPDASAC